MRAPIPGPRWPPPMSPTRCSRTPSGFSRGSQCRRAFSGPPRTPGAAAHELNKMFKDTIRLLPRVTAPVRVFRSTVDHVVSDSSIVALRRGLTNAPLELTLLENSYHVATLDNDAHQIFEGS